MPRFSGSQAIIDAITAAIEVRVYAQDSLVGEQREYLLKRLHLLERTLLTEFPQYAGPAMFQAKDYYDE